MNHQPLWYTMPEGLYVLTVKTQFCANQDKNVGFSKKFIFVIMYNTTK